jgi:hypothetical protein
MKFILNSRFSIVINPYHEKRNFHNLQVSFYKLKVIKYWGRLVKCVRYLSTPVSYQSELKSLNEIHNHRQGCLGVYFVHSQKFYNPETKLQFITRIAISQTFPIFVNNYLICIIL